jgi:hypothetical protein
VIDTWLAASVSLRRALGQPVEPQLARHMLGLLRGVQPFAHAGNLRATGLISNLGVDRRGLLGREIQSNDELFTEKTLESRCQIEVSDDKYCRIRRRFERERLT